MPQPPLSTTDLKTVVSQVGGHWGHLRGKRLFVTGGTGFFGTWLLESLIDANKRLGLGVKATVLTRDPDSFARRAPHLADNETIRLHAGDVRDFARPAELFDYVFHAATEVSKHSQTPPLTQLDSIVGGTRHVLETFKSDPLQAFLYVSSGGVYGAQTESHVDESATTAPPTTDPASTYGQSKRLAEQLCTLYSSQIPVKIARCFAFIGPCMPFDAHLAAGLFIQAALDRKTIQISSDGTPRRSYLYASDLAAWLWTILLAAKQGSIYNVGSDADLSIAELARTTQSVLNPGGPESNVEIAQKPRPGAKPASYVPSIRKAREELGLAPTVDLREAIRRTGEWRLQALQSQRKSL